MLVTEFSLTYKALDLFTKHISFLLWCAYHILVNLTWVLLSFSLGSLCHGQQLSNTFWLSLFKHSHPFLVGCLLRSCTRYLSTGSFSGMAAFTWGRGMPLCLKSSRNLNWPVLVCNRLLPQLFLCKWQILLAVFQETMWAAVESYPRRHSLGLGQLIHPKTIWKLLWNSFCSKVLCKFTVIIFIIIITESHTFCNSYQSSIVDILYWYSSWSHFLYYTVISQPPDSIAQIRVIFIKTHFIAIYRTYGRCSHKDEYLENSW